MTIHAITTHTPAHDTTAHLTYAAQFLNHMHLEERLAHARGEASPRGAKARLGAYTAVGLVCTMYELVASNNAYSLKAVLDALWDRYDDKHMATIGLGGLRSPDRMSAMKTPPNAPASQRFAGKRVYNAEYQRLWQAYQHLFAPMDDTPMLANHRKRARPTRAKVASAAAKPELVPKTALKHEILNAIIASALVIESNNRHPGTTLHDGGILDDHEGHIAVDETHLAVGVRSLPKNKAPGNLMARTHGHSTTLKNAASMAGLTLAVAVARPTQSVDVPLLCLGASLHHPTGGLGSAAVTVIDAIEANNLRAPHPSNRGQKVIVDGGYTNAIDLNRNLTNRGYGMVMKYAKGQRTLHEIQAVKHDDGARTPGIRLFNGRPLCPGASMAQLERTQLKVPDFKDRKKRDGTVRPYSGQELAERESLLNTILPLVMATSGRPQETEYRQRGGQPKHSPPRESRMRVTLTCPHIKGAARCRIFSNYDDPSLEHLPPVPAPPTDLPFDQRPTCCNNESGTISAYIPLKEFKDWQDFMPGTWEHADWYGGPRSANERYNSYLKRTCGGSNLNRGAIAARKAAPFALFVAVAIAHANRSSIESWYANLDSKAGTKPKVRAHANKAKREAALKEYQTEQRRKRKAR